MTDRYDVVVVGGGLAGLATSALLAQAGRSIIVLEKGRQVGGRAYTYVDGGFVLNYGAHAMYRPHTGFLQEVLSRLGEPRIEAPYPDPRKVYFALDDRWGALGPTPLDLLTTKLFPIRARLQLLPLLARLRYAKAIATPDLTWGEWLDQNTNDPYVRRFLLALATINTYTRPAADLSASFFLSHVKRNLFARDYVGYVSGGWSSIYDSFASALRRHGGEIATGTHVQRFVTENGTIAGARTGDRSYEAEAFVLTAPPQEAPKLAEPNSPLRDELQQWSGLQDVRAFCIDLGFPRRLRTDATLIYDVQHDLYFSLHSEVTPDLAPEGGQLLHAMAYLSPEEAADEWLNQRRKTELERALDNYFPGWKESATVQRSIPAAIVTTARQTPDQQGRVRVPARSRSVNNLYFAGDARDLPYNLTETSLASALEVADLLLRAGSSIRGGTTE